MNVYGSVLGGGGKVEYTTSEKVIGTYLGSTLYERTFTGTFPSSISTTGNVTIASNFTYEVREFIGTIHYKDGSVYGYVDLSYNDGASGVVLQTNKTSKTLEFYYYGGSNLGYLSGRPYYVTVRYIK